MSTIIIGYENNGLSILKNFLLELDTKNSAVLTYFAHAFLYKDFAKILNYISDIESFDLALIELLKNPKIDEIFIDLNFLEFQLCKNQNFIKLLKNPIKKLYLVVTDITGCVFKPKKYEYENFSLTLELRACIKYRILLPDKDMNEKNITNIFILYFMKRIKDFEKFKKLYEKNTKICV